MGKKKKGGGENKGKRSPSKSKHRKIQIWNKYELNGKEIKRKGESCPRCGEGTFLANHKGRKTCGKCGYSESATKEE
ncbi:MAG: 30S ribosomal protein S27ae [archaeon]|nr:MAG: 30S ribosomal protein S27ae [archaeon]